MAELCPISEKDVKKARSNSISQLPDHILHSIFCYLTSQDLFHVRLVSKNWHRNTPSYFPLQFDEFIFFKITPTTTAAVLQESHNNFLQSISSSLETCQSELNKAEKRVIRVQFRYHENVNGLFKLINAIDFHEIIGISLVPHIEKINRAWFLQLRSHLKKISNCVALALIIRDETIFSELSKRGHKLWSIPIGRSPTQVVPHIEHLKLDIRLNVPQESHGCLLKYSIDNLLWMSHPNALTLSTPASFAAFALGICNEFLISRKEGNCCTDTQNKCWRHFLKDFMIREVVTDEKVEAKKFNFEFTWQLCS